MIDFKTQICRIPLTFPCKQHHAAVRQLFGLLRHTLFGPYPAKRELPPPVPYTGHHTRIRFRVWYVEWIVRRKGGHIVLHLCRSRVLRGHISYCPPLVCRGVFSLVPDGHLGTQTSLHLPRHDQQGAHLPMVPGKDLEHRTGLRVHHTHAPSTGANKDLPAVGRQAEDVGRTLCVLGLGGWLASTFRTKWRVNKLNQHVLTINIY